MYCSFFHPSLYNRNHQSIHPSFFLHHVYWNVFQLSSIVNKLNCWVHWFFCSHDCQPINLHVWSTFNDFTIYIFIYFIVIFYSFFWLICCLWFFPIFLCLYFKVLYLIFNKLYGFNLLILTRIRFGLKLISVICNSVLLSNTYYTL